MSTATERNAPGRVRDAILQVLAHTSEDLTAKRIAGRVSRIIGPTPESSVRSFLRQLVRGVLPLGEGTVVDPFAGAGSTLAAAEAVGYQSVGIEKDAHYFDLAVNAIGQLADLPIGGER